MFHSLWAFFWLCYYVIKHGITMKGGTRFPFAVCGKKKKQSKGALFWKFSFKISRFSKCDWKCLPIFVLLKCLSYFPWTAKGPFTWSRSLLPPSWIAENFDENVNIKKYKLLNLNYVCFVGLAATFTACIFQ